MYDRLMDPITISAAAGAVINLVDWKKVVKGLANDAVSKRAKGLLEQLKPDDRERAAKRAVQLFVEEFLTELEDKTPLASAVPGYHDQLRRLIESAGPDITGWLQPETKEVDLGPVQRMRCMSSPPDRSTKSWPGTRYDSVMATPAISEGVLYFRTRQSLVAVS